MEYCRNVTHFRQYILKIGVPICKNSALLFQHCWNVARQRARQKLIWRFFGEIPTRKSAYCASISAWHRSLVGLQKKGGETIQFWVSICNGKLNLRLSIPNIILALMTISLRSPSEARSTKDFDWTICNRPSVGGGEKYILVLLRNWRFYKRRSLFNVTNSN